MYLNYLGNYVPNAWNYEHGCGHCHEDVLDLSQFKVSVSARRATASVVEQAEGKRGKFCGAGFNFLGFHKVVFRGQWTGSPSSLEIFFFFPFLHRRGSYGTYAGIYHFFHSSAEAGNV